MNLAALREEFAKTQTEAQALISKASTEGRKLTAEEQEPNDKRFARCDLIRSQISDYNKFASLALEAGNVVLPTEPAGRAAYEQSEGRQAFHDANGNFNMAAYKKAINLFARTGDTRQLFTVTSGTQSGAFLPKEVLQPITVRRLQNAWRGVLAAFGVSPMEVSTTASFSIPVADDTGVVGQATSESATTATSADPSFTSSISISPTLYDSKAAWYSNTVINSNTFDVLAFSLPMLQKRIDKIQESTWTTNVTTNGTVGKTCASATTMTYAELLAWEHSLAAAYRTDAAFVLADSLYKILRGLVDNNNRPVLDLDPTNVFAGKIHNKPVIVSDYLASVAANAIPGAFVSASAIQIVDVMDARLARYSNLPTYPDQVGYEMFQNGDFGFVPNGLSLVKMAIS